MHETDGLNSFDKAKIIESIADDDKKIQAMRETEGLNSWDKAEIIASITDDDKKIQAMRETEGLNSWDKAEIIASITDDDKKIQAMRETEDIDSEDKAEIIASIKDEDKKIQTMRETEDIDSEDKAEIIESIKDEDKKIKALQEIHDLDLYEKAKIIESITDDDKKIRLMQETVGLDSSDKGRIIESIKDDDKKVQVMRDTDDLDSWNKVSIIESITDDDKKVQAMRDTDGFSLNDAIKIRMKKRIIKTIKDDDKKIQTMRDIDGFDSGDKAEIIISIKDDDKKIQATRETEGLNSYYKPEIIASIRDDDKKIQAMQEIDGLDSEKKADIILETIKQEEKRIKALQEIDGLDSGDKGRIIRTIKDEEKRINLMQETDGLDPYEKAYIIKTLTDDDEKIRLMKETEGLDSYDKSIILESLTDDDKKIRIMHETKGINPEDMVSIIQSIQDKDKKMAGISIIFGVDEKLLHRMYALNNDILQTLNPRILQQKYLETLGEEKIKVISCFSGVQERILDLTDKQLILFDRCIDIYMEQNNTDEWTNLAEALLKNIGNYDNLLESIDDISKLDVEDIKALARIMQSENWCNIETMEQVKNYDRIREENCQWIMKEKDAPIDLKINAVFQKLFGHDLAYAYMMVEKYGEDIENIDDCEMKDYIRSLKLILETDDSNILQEIFDQCEFAEIDKILAERTLKNEYLKKYLDGLYVPKDEDRVEGKSNIYEAGTDFKIIMTSVSPYSEKSRKIRNYYKDWNRPTLSCQHFCASYIRNDMIGTPEIPHICYGFSALKEDSLMLSGPKDIFSSDTGWVSIAQENERYYTPDTQIEKTEDFNEMDIRRIQNGVKIQPDYIIVFRKDKKIPNMEEAKRASKDWGGMPIVIVDIDKCLESERQKVETMLEEYRENESSELARRIIQKVRKNRVTYKMFCQDIKTELSRIRQILGQESENENEFVNEDQLEEIYEKVPANERQKTVTIMKAVYSRVQRIIEEGHRISR